MQSWQQLGCLLGAPCQQEVEEESVCPEAGAIYSPSLPPLHSVALSDISLALVIECSSFYRAGDHVPRITGGMPVCIHTNQPLQRLLLHTLTHREDVNSDISWFSHINTTLGLMVNGFCSGPIH